MLYFKLILQKKKKKVELFLCKFLFPLIELNFIDKDETGYHMTTARSRCQTKPRKNLATLRPSFRTSSMDKTMQMYKLLSGNLLDLR